MEVRTNTAGGAPVARRDASSGQARISGYATVTNSETIIAGLFREVVAPGAFRAALTRRDDVRCLLNHNADLILGRTKSGTLSLVEDAHGLKYTVTPPATAWADGIVVSIARGDISGSSFAFRVERESWPAIGRAAMPLRVIEQVELFDVSPVCFPAYAATSVNADLARAVAATGTDTAAAAHHRQRLLQLAAAERATESDRRRAWLRRAEYGLSPLTWNKGAGTC
jgi:HK97 family phage prohead protease